MSTGVQPKRARYHSSVLTIGELCSEQDIEDIPETYTVFIMEKDFYGKGKPFYRIGRTNIHTYELYRDKSHTIYVNGEYCDNSNIGYLMHDFNCSNPDDMYFPLMAEKTRYLKKMGKCE